MRRAVVAGMLVAVICSAFAAWGAAGKTAAKKPQAGKLRHVVLLKFKEGTAPKQIKAIEDAFAALPSKIPTIVDFEWGTNISEEGLTDGFTHCFLVTFKDVKGRKVYLPHAAHKGFVKLLLPHLDKVLVMDYTAKK